MDKFPSVFLQEVTNANEFAVDIVCRIRD